jgi:sulfotransferase
MLMCVRDIPWVLDSFERLFRKNPYDKQLMIPDEHATTVYSRCDYLMHESSTIGFAYLALKEGISSEFKSSIMIIEYEQLCKNPEGMMRAVYNFLGEPYFNHDFNNVEASYDEFDLDVNVKGLHTTRKKIEWIERETVIPPDIWNKYSGGEVWRA